MIKRVFGVLLFLWMAAYMVGLFLEDFPGPAGGTAIAMKIGIGSFIFAAAIIGLTMAFGKQNADGPVDLVD